MPRKKKITTASTALVATTATLPTITRADANRKLKERAQELYHQARTQREESIRRFEAEFGRSDRIDQTLLKDLQSIQVRFAAIGIRQTRYGIGAEPKVSRFARALGEIIGEVSAHLATERALELFAPVDEHDYVGSGGMIGRKGLDESVLAGYQIIDDPLGSRGTASAIEDDADEVCLHEQVEPFDDEPGHGVCLACGEEFELRYRAVDPEDGDADGASSGTSGFAEAA